MKAKFRTGTIAQGRRLLSEKYYGGDEILFEKTWQTSFQKWAKTCFLIQDLKIQDLIFQKNWKAKKYNLCCDVGSSVVIGVHTINT